MIASAPTGSVVPAARESAPEPSAPSATPTPPGEPTPPGGPGGPGAPISRDELRERTFDGVRWFSLTRGLAETTQIVAAVVLARLVSPGQFGRLAVAIIVNEFANCIAAETIGTPVIQRTDLRREHLEAAAFLGVVIGAGLGLVTLFAIPLVTTPVFGAQTSSLFELFAPAFALTGLQIVPLAQLNRDLRFRHIGVVEVIGVLTASAVAIALAILGLGAKSYVIGVLAGLVVCTAGYVRGSGIVWPRWRPREMRELLRFGLPASAAGLAGVTYRNIDYMVLGIRLPAVTVGYYYRAFTLGVEYERRMSGIIARLAFPVYSRATDAAHRRELRTRIARANVTAIYPLLALFIIMAPALIPWLFGHRWQPAVLPAQILAVAGMASTLRSLTGPSVLAAGRPRALLAFSAAEAVLYGMTVWLASSHGLAVICCAVAAFQIMSVIIAYTVLLNRTVGLPVGQLVHDVGPALISCLPLAATGVGLRLLLGPGFPVLAMVAIVTPLGLAAYLLTMRALFSGAWVDITLLAARIAPARKGARSDAEVPTESPIAVSPARPARPARPDLSVIMVTHNRAALAIDTLRSARAATGALTVEWLVVDSGSTDDAPALIERAFDDIDVLRCPNIGFAAANNRAIPHARGRYVLFLNPDVEIVRGDFATVLARLDAQPDIGLASVIQRAPDGALQYSIRRDPAVWRTLAEALGVPRIGALRGWGERELAPERYGTERRADWVVGALLIVRAEAMRAVGPFDERFFLYSEETDWCFRFRQAGWGVAHLPQMTVIHHTTGEYAPDLLAQLSYAKVLFAAKHYGPRRAVWMCETLALRHFLRLLACAARPRGSSGARRLDAERRALSVLLGRSQPPFAVQQTVAAAPQVHTLLSRSSSR